jgi:hypothetical protein
MPTFRVMPLALLLGGALALPAYGATPQVSPERPHLAFLELAGGPGVDAAVAGVAGDLLVVALSQTGKFEVITKSDVKALLGLEAQSQLIGCAESSCMVDLGGALGAAYLVNGSLGKLGGQYQLVLSLIDVNRATVGQRLVQPIADEAAIPRAVREAVTKLTGEVVPDAGPLDACSVPPCAKEAISTCRRWWEKEWDLLTIIGIVPDGPYEQKLVEHKPSRIFRLLVRTRGRDGSRSEYLAFIRYQRVEGDWFFDSGSMNYLRDLPIVPDDPPAEPKLLKILSDGFAAAHPHSTVQTLVPWRFPNYERATSDAPARWSYQFDVAYHQDGTPKTCPKASGKLVKTGQDWRYEAGSDGSRCTDVLDAP